MGAGVDIVNTNAIQMNIYVGRDKWLWLYSCPLGQMVGKVKAPFKAENNVVLVEKYLLNRFTVLK